MKFSWDTASPRVFHEHRQKLSGVMLVKVTVYREIKILHCI